MLTIEQIRRVLREEDLKALKSLGQNFLIDKEALADIVRTAGIAKEDTIIEVGPGMGVLTFALAERCRRVIAIEKDRKMSKYLRGEIAKKYGNEERIEVVNDDILKINLPEFIGARGISRYKVVANIPYYITSPIIRLFLETPMPPSEMVLLVQKEVAERICAPKGGMSILALSVLLYGEPETVRTVGKASFYPAPKVDSAVLRIKDIGKKYPDDDYPKIFRLIKIGFSAKRKKLVNNLSAGLRLPKDEILAKLSFAGIGADVRAEDLGVEEWVRLAKELV
jgi:16S rRNA (adenine1518-N6/adenine1519-N6)-dimethyltransferase